MIFHIQVILFEESQIGYALKRSSQLVRNSWWRIIGITILIIFVSYIIVLILKVSVAFILVFMNLAGNTNLRNIIEWAGMNNVLDSNNIFFYAFMTCIDLILTSLVFPIWSIGITLLYIDRRIRIDGEHIALVE